MDYYESTLPILAVENLSVSYDGKTIIQNINFEEKDVVRPNCIQGQTIGFVGRSGRGKSTLFRCLAGLQQPTEGSIHISDIAAQKGNEEPPLKAVAEGDVGFVSQNYVLFRHKTIYQAMQFAMRKIDLPKEEKRKKILEHLKRWGLEHVKDQYPNELSGGQRQRTAILEQILSSTNYIILDEPFSGLDVGNIQNVISAFNLINQSHELNTIIFCTHDIELAVALADTIYVIGYPRNEDGKLEKIGTIVNKYDLKAMGLAWQSKLTEAHHQLIENVKKAILAS